MPYNCGNDHYKEAEPIFFSDLLRENIASCYNALYELIPEIGKGIACGEYVEILPEYLTRVGNGGYGYLKKICNHYGYETTEAFALCIQGLSCLCGVWR